MSHTTTLTRGPALHGVMAEFENEHDIIHAAKKMYDLGYRKMDGYTPFPVHGLDDALGIKRTKLPILVLGGGLAGAIGGMAMMTFSAVIDYPINVAGRPYFSWPMFIPITFELTVLIASLTAVFGMLALNGFPEPYHPTFNVPAFERASSNSFFLCVESTDPKFDVQKIRSEFEATDARGVYDVPE